MIGRTDEREKRKRKAERVRPEVSEINAVTPGPRSGWDDLIIIIKEREKVGDKDASSNRL
jgi:hypothetical protein